MNYSRVGLLGAVAGALLAGSGCVPAVKTASEDESSADGIQAKVYRSLMADTVVANWPPISAQAGRRMIEIYGVPDAVRSDQLVWRNNGPWKRTVVRDVTPPYVQAEDLGVVEQSIEYPLTTHQAAELAAFDRKLEYDSFRRELSARSDREEVNFLRLNLANDVVNRRATPEQAQHLYSRTLALEAAGKSSSYMQVLQFAR